MLLYFGRRVGGLCSHLQDISTFDNTLVQMYLNESDSFVLEDQWQLCFPTEIISLMRILHEIGKPIVFVLHTRLKHFS